MPPYLKGHLYRLIALRRLAVDQQRRVFASIGSGDLHRFHVMVHREDAVLLIQLAEFRSQFVTLYPHVQNLRNFRGVGFGYLGVLEIGASVDAHPQISALVVGQIELMHQFPINIGEEIVVVDNNLELVVLFVHLEQIGRVQIPDVVVAEEGIAGTYVKFPKPGVPIPPVATAAGAVHVKDIGVIPGVLGLRAKH